MTVECEGVGKHHPGMEAGLEFMVWFGDLFGGLLLVLLCKLFTLLNPLRSLKMQRKLIMFLHSVAKW